MFELERALREWRASFGDSMDSEALSELEEHLRSEMDALSNAGLSPQEALLIARGRLGADRELENEFAKVHPESAWIARVQWMLLGFLGVNAMVGAAGVLTQLAGLGSTVLGLEVAGAVGLQMAVRVIGCGALFWVFFKYIQSPHGQGRRLVFLSVMLALASLMFILGSGVIRVGQARILSLEEMGQTTLNGYWVSLGWAILFPLALAILVHSLEKKRPPIHE